MLSLLRTENNIAYSLARVILGVVILPHGLQKTLGMFGGYGLTATVDFFTGMGTPVLVAYLVILGESLGSIALIVGFLGRIGAFGIALIMTGAIFLVHIQNGFFMNWTGNQNGEGYEYHLLAIGLSLIVVVKGSGKWSLDYAIAGD
jgi:putative oxidoreductase